MEIYRDKSGTRLVYVRDGVSPEVWSSIWGANEDWINRITKKIVRNSRPFKLVSRHTPAGGRVLEGGCGMGQFVFNLELAGFSVTGVDYAKDVVDTLNQELPQLDVVVDDLRELNTIESSSYDTYYSGGVIEHFYDGYGELATQMERVLKPGGVLILTFPFMSRVRKVCADRYAVIPDERVRDFFQFALDPDEVKRSFCEMGFIFVSDRARNGLKGFQEAHGSSTIMRTLQLGWGGLLGRILRRVVGDILSVFGYGHSIEMVFRKPYLNGENH